jgi:hypothetical protein
LTISCASTVGYQTLRGPQRERPAPQGENEKRQATNPQAIGAVKKRTQLKGKLMGKTAWTKRDKTDSKFIVVKKSPKKFKGVRKERKAA